MLLLGWNEWCALPGLGIPAIKAKIDTGAKTSAIHAFDIKPFSHKGSHHIHFNIHPIQGKDDVIVACKAAVVDQRFIMSSNGHKEHRYVIKTPLTIGGFTWEIQITLSNRDPLTYRMLLGREALGRNIMIDPAHALRQGKIPFKKLRELYP